MVDEPGEGPPPSGLPPIKFEPAAHSPAPEVNEDEVPLDCLVLALDGSRHDADPDAPLVLAGTYRISSGQYPRLGIPIRSLVLVLVDRETSIPLTATLAWDQLLGAPPVPAYAGSFSLDLRAQFGLGDRRGRFLLTGSLFRWTANLIPFELVEPPPLPEVATLE